MRFSNWDVLLFPDTSKTPIQEFKTVCHVVQDPDFIPDLTNGMSHPRFSSCHLRLRRIFHPVIDSMLIMLRADANTPYERSLPQQLPTVAAFVPSLAHDEPFRISIHSWEPLVPISKAARAVSTSNRFYEARVMIDGIRVAQVKQSTMYATGC